MKKQKMFLSIPGLCLMVLLAGAALGNAEDPRPPALPAAEISGFSPEKALSDDKTLKPGLSVIYIYKYFRHIDQMPVQDPNLTAEKAGSPITFLNHHFEKEDLIFDSGVSQGIGIQLNGFLKFSEAGKYSIMALSNDGIRIEVCQKTVLIDPSVHSDRFTPQAVMDIPKPRCNTVMIKYFQRKGTAAIELHWKPPGKADFSIVPAEAYAHAASSTGSP